MFLLSVVTILDLLSKFLCNLCVVTGGSDGKESACNAGDPGLIPGLGRSPGEGNGNPLQYSYLENSMDREAWQVTTHAVAESDTSCYLFRSLEGFFFFPLHLSYRIYCTKSCIFLHHWNVCGTYSSVPSLITDSTGNSCSFSKFLNQFRVGFPKFSTIYISVQISLCWRRKF